MVSSVATLDERRRRRAVQRGQVGTRIAGLHPGQGGAAPRDPCQCGRPRPGRVSEMGRRLVKATRRGGHRTPSMPSRLTAMCAQPEDVARVVLFMVSGLSGYVTGQRVEVDGGAWHGPMSRAHDDVSLYEGLLSTRAIRRYTDEPVPDEALRDILFAATRAPSGSNRQPFRFIVLTDGPVAEEAKRLIGAGARRFWAAKRAADGYDKGSGAAGRLAQGAAWPAPCSTTSTPTSRCPCVVLACFVRYRHTSYTDGASVYPACQNLLLAARALGYGGVMTSWQFAGRRRTARAAAASPTTWRSWPPSPWAAPGAPRPGAPAAAPRAGLRGAVGRGPRLGGRPRRASRHTAAGPPTAHLISLVCSADATPRGRLTHAHSRLTRSSTPTTTTTRRSTPSPATSTRRSGRG